MHPSKHQPDLLDGLTLAACVAACTSAEDMSIHIHEGMQVGHALVQVGQVGGVWSMACGGASWCMLPSPQGPSLTLDVISE